MIVESLKTPKFLLWRLLELDVCTCWSGSTSCDLPLIIQMLSLIPVVIADLNSPRDEGADCGLSLAARLGFSGIPASSEQVSVLGHVEERSDWFLGFRDVHNLQKCMTDGILHRYH